MSDWWSNDPVAETKSAAPPSPYAGAISSVESGGRYDATGPVTRSGDRAHGKYQIMGANIGPWSQEVFGRPLSVEEFRSSPEAQDAVFNAKFGSYVQKYGPEGAAKAWFAGEKGMHNPNARDVLGTSVADYARKFNKAGGQSTDVSAQARPAGDWWASDPVAPAQQPQPAQAQPQQDAPVAAQPAPSPTVGVGESVASGAAQGVTFNLYDELRGLMEAGGLNPRDPASLGALLKGAASYWSGDKQAEQTYNAASERERATAKAAAEANPTASLAGNVAGAVALPIGGLLGAATMPARVGRGATVGAASGAAYGAGEGVGLEDRASKAASGALIGGGIGAAAPPILAAIGSGVGKITEPIANTLRGLANPEAEASRRVFSAIKRDADTGRAGLTPAEFVTAKAEGSPVANMDMGGEMTRAMARSAANTSPEARAALERTTSDRFGSQGERAVDFVQGLVRTPANASVTREALEDAAQKYRKPFYDKAYKDGSKGIWDEDLETLGQSPVMQQAIKDAAQSIGNKTATGRSMYPITPDGKPTLEFWDQVKRSLDSQYSVLSRKGDKEAAADILGTKKALVAKLDAAVPSYEVARGVSSEFFKAGSALEAGEKFVRMNVGLDDAAKALGKMSPEEKTLFREGFVSRLIEDINAKGDRTNIINKITGSQAARRKVEMALGPQGAQKLEGFIRVESILDRARGAVSGNSTTVRQLMEAGLAGGAYGAATGDLADPKNVLVAALTFGARRGQMKIDQRVATRVGEMLASSDPQVLQKGLDLVTRNKGMMQSLRNADSYAAKLAGVESSKDAVPALQAMGTSRAEDE